MPCVGLFAEVKKLFAEIAYNFLIIFISGRMNIRTGKKDRLRSKIPVLF